MKKNKMIFQILILLVVIYLIICSLIYLNQRKLLYHPNENNYLDEKNLNHKIEKITINSEFDLSGWYFEKDPSFKTIVFFHGNAGNLQNRIYKLNEFSKLDVNYLIFAYRGFNGNNGFPNEEGLYEDANAAIKWLNKKGTKNENIVLYGESLGTAIAINQGSKNKFGGMILESPFTSMVDLAKKYYPYLPVKILLKDQYNSENKINLINFPVLVMHGEKDKIVPFYMGKKIYNKLPGEKFSYFIKNDDHMMEFNKNLIFSIKSFLEGLK